MLLQNIKKSTSIGETVSRRRKQKGDKLSKRSALKKLVNLPSRDLGSVIHKNLIKTGSLVNAFYYDFELFHKA